MTDSDFNYLVGMTVEAAKEQLPTKYFLFICENNGESFYRQMDFNPYRVNVVVRNNQIKKIDGVN